MEKMKLEISGEINEKYSFKKRKRKLDYKKIIFFLFIIIIIITWILFVCSLFLRIKIIKRKEKTFDSKLNLPHLYSKKKYKSEELMKMVKYNSTYANAAKCFTNDPEKELCLYQFLVPKKVVGKNLKLIGPRHDGGYVLLDDFENISIAYSVGIDHEISFDKALAGKNIDIYMYDHTINSLLYNNPKFHWTKKGISGISNKNNETETLEEMLEENGHINEKNMILKIDVEYAEWQALLDTPEEILKKFKYITIEFHFRKELEKYFQVLKKLYQTHQVIYLVCNNYHNSFSFLGNNIICSCIEISYIIREGNEFYKDNTTYPIPGIKLKNYNRPEHSYNLNIIKLFDN